MEIVSKSEARILASRIETDISKLGKIYKAKKNNYELISVETKFIDEYKINGWEEYTKPLKTKVKLRKEKDYKQKFIDEVWCQLYELGYRKLSVSPVKLKGTRNEDIIANIISINDDSILIIECHSRQNPIKPKNSYYKKFILIDDILNLYKRALLRECGKDKKIKFIFATRNLRIDRESQDIEALKSSNSFFYNDNTYEYFNSLLKSYKGVANYQFMAILFKGQFINKDKYELPAIQGRMGGKKYYMFSIEPHLLLKIGFILHRTRANESEMPTYQRLLVPTRLKGISKFINSGGYFPNSIIINFKKGKNGIRFEPMSKSDNSKAKTGIVKIPNAYSTAYIIDGQHRVYGYANSEYKKSNTIPVVAFEGLESSEQLGIFMDINENQKAVSPTLRITLEEDLYWNSDRADSRMKALRSSIIQGLSSEINGSLFGKIAVGEDKALLAAKPFANAFLRSGLLPQAKGNSFVDKGNSASIYNLNCSDPQKEMRRVRNSIIKFINYCYQFVEDSYPDIFSRDKYFIMSNRGTYAFVSLIGSLNKFETESGVVNHMSSPENRFYTIKKYINALLDQINKLSKEEEERMLVKLGGGADTAWLRFFQSLVNKKYSKYNPVELIDWKERQDHELQEKGRKLGTEIEKYIKNIVLIGLKEIHGKNWDLEIASIKRDCEKRASEEIERQYKELGKRKRIEWTEMFFVTDYKKIIDSNWTKKPHENFVTFAETFSIDCGYGFNSKAEKLKWISIFNGHRNNWAHAGTKEKGLNRDEVSFLEEIYSKLITK